MEKTAGQSGGAGRLRNKWIAFLQTSVGKEIAARLATSAPTVEDAKAFSTWVYSTRQRWLGW